VCVCGLTGKFFGGASESGRYVFDLMEFSLSMMIWSFDEDRLR